MLPEFLNGIKEIYNQFVDEDGGMENYEEYSKSLRDYLADQLRDWEENASYVVCIERDFHPEVYQYEKLSEAIFCLATSIVFWFESSQYNKDEKAYIIPCSNGISFVRKDVSITKEE